MIGAAGGVGTLRDAARVDGGQAGRARLLIVWHSTTGATRQLVEAAAQGAADEPSVDTRLSRCDLTGPEAVLDASCYLFATPENLASMAGLMKDFFDRCYYPVLERIAGRPYALLVCAGSDGSGAVRQLERIATGWRLRRVAAPLVVCTEAQSPEAIVAPKRLRAEQFGRARELGAALAAGTALGIW